MRDYGLFKSGAEGSDRCTRETSDQDTKSYGGSGIEVKKKEERERGVRMLEATVHFSAVERVARVFIILILSLMKDVDGGDGRVSLATDCFEFVRPASSAKAMTYVPGSEWIRAEKASGLTTFSFLSDCPTHD